MNRTLKISMLLLAAALAGCAVRDGHEDEPAPIWWPNFVYRPSTHPTEEEYDQAKGAAVDSPVYASVDNNAASHDVRTDWNPNYAEHPVPLVTSGTTSGDALARPVQTEDPAAATLYPNRGQAALAAHSATLYPPTNQFNGGPAHTASVFPQGPLAPTGYRGR